MARNYDGATIEVINWEKYNPKRDQKTYTWLRLDNSISTDPEFFGLDAEQKFVWIEILCQCSKQNNSSVRLNLGYISHITGVKKDKITALVDFLLQKPIVRVHDNARSHAVAVVSEQVSHTTPTNETYVRDERDERDVRTYSDGLASEPARTPAQTVWEFYSKAYERRHGTAPVRNATVNSQIKSYVSRLPLEEAAEVAAFYVSHNDSFYVKNLHPVGLLLKDAEKLRTEWKTGRKMTVVQAKSAESVDHYQEQLKRIAEGKL